MARLILDIETFALDGAGEFIEEPSAPANYKDPAKIDAYIAERKADLLTKCALDVDLCRVVCAAWTTEGETVDYMAAALDDDAERLLLERVARQIGIRSQIIGFNILAFDLPVLIRRAQYLGVEFPGIALDKYRTPHLDLMEFLSFQGKVKVRSLDFYAKRFGIAVADKTNGKDIDALVKAGNWQGVIDHCTADVRKVRALAARLNIIAPVIAEPAEVF